MENLRCQSCGMPLGKGFFGTNKNKSLNEEFCKYCFKEGKFTKPNLKMNEMIELSVSNLIKELKLNKEEAEFLTFKTIPKLSRWKRQYI